MGSILRKNLFYVSLPLTVALSDGMGSSFEGEQIGTGNKYIEEDYPINTPLPSEIHPIYQKLEQVFENEKTLILSYGILAKLSDTMQKINLNFSILPSKATKEQLMPLLMNTHAYLDGFCTSYANVIQAFKEHVECRRAVLDRSNSFHAPTTSNTELVLGISMELDGSQKLSPETAKALKAVVSHPEMFAWFYSVTNSQPIQPTHVRRSIRTQASVDGIHAAIKELSQPSLMHDYSREAETWGWFSQLFLVRKESLALLNPCMLQHLEKNATVKDTVAVVAQSPDHKRGRLRSFFCCSATGD